MIDAAAIAARLASLVPGPDRRRYEEQWAADLRDADELGLPRGQLVRAAGRIVVALQLRALRAQRLHSPVLWTALCAAAVVACLYGGAVIALNTSDGTSSAFLGVVGLTMGLIALRHLSRPLSARVALAAGTLLTAEGFAVVWLGHMGHIEIAVGAALLLLGLVGTVRRIGLRAPVGAVALVLRGVGATLLLACALGIGGQYLDARLNAGGFDCLEGFAGDPGGYPSAPSVAGDIRTGFSWYPLGRTCSWGAGTPAAIQGVVTTADTDVQGDALTSDWTYGLGIGGLLLLALAAGARRVTRPSDDKHA